MTSEPHRLQYLEAMGLTAWVARYQLPNARPSEACEWPEPSAELSVRPGAEPSGKQQTPGARLQALLTPQVEPVPASPADQADPENHGMSSGEPLVDAESHAPPRRPMPRRARALLGDLAPEEGAGLPEYKQGQEPGSGRASSSVEQTPWQFSLQVACLDGRWLVLAPGEQALSVTEVRLLARLFAAADMALEQPPSFERYRWPPFQVASQGVQALGQGLCQDPRQDAQDGLCAFLAGRQRLGWKPRRVFVFGMNEMLEALLAIDGEHSASLDLPVWLGPELGALSTSATAKRALWPRLAKWRPADHD